MTAWQALRGGSWVTAATMAAECGDLAQFPRPPQRTSFLGLVPTEWSRGGTRRQGGLTKTGNVHVRRVLVEAAWSHRYQPTRQGRVGRRWATLPADWRAAREPIGWRAQQRLHTRWRRLVGRRGWTKAAAAWPGNAAAISGKLRSGGGSRRPPPRPPARRLTPRNAISLLPGIAGEGVLGVDRAANPGGSSRSLCGTKPLASSPRA